MFATGCGFALLALHPLPDLGCLRGVLMGGFPDLLLDLPTGSVVESSQAFGESDNKAAFFRYGI